MSGFLNTVAINLPEPSGSSPAEKPPGIIIIWLSFIRFVISLTESVISEAVKFLITKISLSAPALLNAFIVSYSQFVPGNTGMNTRGFANDDLQTSGHPFVYSAFSSLPSIFAVFVGYTASNGFSQAAKSSSIDILTSPTKINSSFVVLPIFSAFISVPAGTSTMIEPISASKSLSFTLSQRLTPILLPKDILAKASATPPERTV